MSDDWAMAIFLSIVMICVTRIIVSNQWTILTRIVIENNGTMMCQPVICSCEWGSPNSFYDIYWDENHTIYTNFSGGKK